MKHSGNKKQLIQLMCSNNTADNIHMIGEEQNMFDHEEADVSIISYLFFLHQCGELEHIQVRCDDTDILILLLYFYWNMKPNIQITMKKFDESIIDINATATKLGNTCDQLLAMHALTGCDTTSYPYSKGKTTGFNVRLKHPVIGLECFGEEDISKDELFDVGSKFFCYLYGSETCVSMACLRYKLFSSNKRTPCIKSLPPTDEALMQHCLRCHLQIRIWKLALEELLPIMNITD